jgi:type II secretory pathway component GspD/PulD (secretin)
VNGGIQIKCGGIRFYSGETYVPKGDAMITYVMTLQHLAPKEAIQVFSKHIDKSDPAWSVASVPNAHAIVVTCRASNIRKLIALKKEIDKPWKLSEKAEKERVHVER